MPQGTSTATVVKPQGDLEIVIIREFAAPARLVFDAWTNCEHVPRWFGRPASWKLTCEIDLRPGGKWRFLMQNDAGEKMGLYGEYLEMAHPIGS